MKRSNKNEIHLASGVSSHGHLADNDIVIEYGLIRVKKHGKRRYRTREIDHVYGVNKTIGNANSHVDYVDAYSGCVRGYDHNEH